MLSLGPVLSVFRFRKETHSRAFNESVTWQFGLGMHWFRDAVRRGDSKSPSNRKVRPKSVWGAHLLSAVNHSLSSSRIEHGRPGSGTCSRESGKRVVPKRSLGKCSAASVKRKVLCEKKSSKATTVRKGLFLTSREKKLFGNGVARAKTGKPSVKRKVPKRFSDMSDSQRRVFISKLELRLQPGSVPRALKDTLGVDWPVQAFKDLNRLGRHWVLRFWGRKYPFVSRDSSRCSECVRRRLPERWAISCTRCPVGKTIAVCKGCRKETPVADLLWSRGFGDLCNQGDRDAAPVKACACWSLGPVEVSLEVRSG
jgi:hypothetical protein